MDAPVNNSQTPPTTQTSATYPIDSAFPGEEVMSTPTNPMAQGNFIPANGNLIYLNVSSQISFKLKWWKLCILEVPNDTCCSVMDSLDSMTALNHVHQKPTPTFSSGHVRIV
ncbi:Uncharacterized protein Fot_11829 [Forsythia ovata]|uniref:Uncharacterized protein n=1 Tax=Forsythia ovata TaxID=205694 RepID=A0ABD1WKT0_9LAMI